MHETGLAQEIVNIVEEIARQHSPKQVIRITLNIGEMVAVVPDMLKFAFQAIVENTPLNNARLEVQIIPVTAVCNKCRKSFHISQFEFSCPYCSSVDLTVRSGDEFLIKELEFKECP
ncbi:hydrogenase maturation nickel metallochaperone HypA [candidate division KSB1 bacterium]|nr:hydrogenase maturation nickel metallochaperone HypA [candidate division KSB1 bacterium]